MEDWINFAETNVTVVGASPAGLTAAMYLAKAGLKKVVFERKPSSAAAMGVVR